MLSLLCVVTLLDARILLKSPWEPRLAAVSEPTYQRLASAIAEDLSSGKI